MLVDSKKALKLYKESTLDWEPDVLDRQSIHENVSHKLRVRLTVLI